MEDWHNFGPDYDLTLMAWRANIDAAWVELGDRYDDRFRRMWEWYLLSSAGSFPGTCAPAVAGRAVTRRVAGGYRAPGIR